jgi:hypothetical protein
VISILDKYLGRVDVSISFEKISFYNQRIIYNELEELNIRGIKHYKLKKKWAICKTLCLSITYSLIKC